jgi:multidrug efflux pump subunit AcrA (membrane-fusion protein)
MTKKHKISKKLVVFLVVLLLIVILITVALMSKSKSNNAAYVTPVSDMNNTWILDESGSEGIISDAAAQNVYVNTAEEIAEVCVTEGQTVAKGDVLLTYDINTLSSELEVAQLTKSAKTDQLAVEQKKLENDKQVAVRSAEDSAAVEARVDTIETRMQQLLVYMEQLQEEMNEAVSGQPAGDAEDATEENLGGDGVDDGDTSQAAAEQQNAERAAQMQAYQSEYDTLSKELDGIESDTTRYYTQAEKDALIAEQELEIRRVQNSIRSSELDISNLQKQIADAKVTATMDGIVSYIGENPKANDGNPYMTIVALSGLSVKGFVDEYQVDKVKVGDKITVQSWESGAQTTATIMEISSYPSDQSMTYRYGNSNFSDYEYIAYMEETTGFYADEYVSIKQYRETDSIVLESVYVRSDDEGDYVLIDDGNGTLKRQAVVTQDTSEAEYVEITEGLSEDDMIAFPYGKSGFAGNITTTVQAFSLF